MEKSQYKRAVKWAVEHDYLITVRAYGEMESEIEYSLSQKNVIEAIQSIGEIVNVELFNHAKEYLLTFSVIDEGNPEEDINDWTIPHEDADAWRILAFADFEKVITDNHPGH